LCRAQRRIEADGLPEFGYGFIHSAEFGEGNAEVVKQFRTGGPLFNLEGDCVLCNSFV
jgi:hypothetical protein